MFLYNFNLRPYTKLTATDNVDINFYGKDSTCTSVVYSINDCECGKCCTITLMGESSDGYLTCTSDSSSTSGSSTTTDSSTGSSIDSSTTVYASTTTDSSTTTGEVGQCRLTPG